MSPKKWTQQKRNIEPPLKSFVNNFSWLIGPCREQSYCFNKYWSFWLERMVKALETGCSQSQPFLHPCSVSKIPTRHLVAFLLWDNNVSSWVVRVGDFQKQPLEPAVVVRAHTSVLGRQTQEDRCKFKTSLGFIASSRLSEVIQQDSVNQTNKNKTEQKLTD